MLKNPRFVCDDVAEIKQLIRDSPWATFVVNTDEGLRASHYPVMLEEAPGEDASEEASGDIVLLSHMGKNDEVLGGEASGGEVGGSSAPSRPREMMVIVQGMHGYVSPSWYPPGAVVPTWNHLTAHFWGTPEILSAEENFEVLSRLVDHFEAAVPHPRSLKMDEDSARRQALGTRGIRLRVTRLEAYTKLSQNRPEGVTRGIVEHMREDGPYSHPALADAIERQLEA